MSAATLTLKGPMNRYSYRGMVFQRDVPKQVHTNLANEIAEGPDGEHFKLEVVKGGVTIVGAKEKSNAKSFKKKADCEAYARDEFDVELDKRKSLKDLNAILKMLSEGVSASDIDGATSLSDDGEGEGDGEVAEI